MTSDKAQELGIEPEARIVAYAYAAVDPAFMGLGPAYAIPKVLRRAGMKLEDIGVIELNEAFAAQVLADAIELKNQGYELNFKIVNPNGGAIALGHPVGATGARQVATLLPELRRRDATYGLVSMCVGGGQGGALILENLD
jgi:acetyl-CoA acetyltransferase